jgi:hypothetical protein
MGKRLDLKPGKIGDVERQNPADAMHVHDGHKPRIVDLGTANGISDDKALPFLVSRWRIRQTGKHPLDFNEFAQSEGRRDPKPLAAIGRVITFQNSAIFCNVK